MESVLFIPYIIESHLVPTLGMAKLLREKYRVVYALPKKFQWFAQLHGYEYANLESVPFAFGYEPVLRRAEGSKSVYRDSFRDRKNGRIAKHRRKKLREIVDNVQPVFIFSDILSSTDFILLFSYLKEKNAAFAIHNPMLSTYTINNIPRIGSSLMIDEQAKTSLEHLSIKLITGVFNLRQSILYPFNTDRHLIKREFEKNHIPHRYHLAADNHFTKLFEQVPEIITAPEELEFVTGKKKENQFYVGPLIDEKRSEKKSIDELPELIDTIKNWKQDKGVKIIFCAFGTMPQNNRPTISLFIHKLISIFSKHANLKLLCAFDDKDNTIDKRQLPANVFLFSWLPQLSILPYANLFITHAGLGSVKEAIHHAVPMLAYPFTKSWDSNGNATKIAYHRLGLRGNIRTDTEEEIEKKIDQLLTNDEYRNAIRYFQERMNEKYTPNNFLNFFEQLKRSVNWQ